MRFWNSSIGKKAVMAVTGLAMIAFLIVHMAGNLQMFSGPLKINEYAAALRRLGPLLWVARVGLLVALVLHVIAAYQLTQRKQVARPVGYERDEPQISTFAARTIRWGGVLLLARAGRGHLAASPPLRHPPHRAVGLAGEVHVSLVDEEPHRAADRRCDRSGAACLLQMREHAAHWSFQVSRGHEQDSFVDAGREEARRGGFFFRQSRAGRRARGPSGRGARGDSHADGCAANES
jgi:hypothetical protein